MAANNPPYVRHNVWTLAAGDPAVADYAKAVEVMMARSGDDPTSWTYQAAMHGTHTSPAKTLWNGCQHGTWFFLAWHRLFIYYFEAIVRAAVVEAGGAADWALPYWDYGSGGQQATLPITFRNAKVNGSKNPLYVAARAPGINAGLALSPAVTSAAHALSRPRFTGVLQFGGGVTPVAQFSGSTGQVEQTPHNDVHVAVGGPNGWMIDPDRAAADPIFWLHHANIDRLWVVWTSPTQTPPSNPAWLKQTFSFFDANGDLVVRTLADAVDIVGGLGYTYDEAVVPATAPTPGKDEAAITVPSDTEADDREPELVGASDRPLELVGAPATVGVAIDPKARDAVLKDAARTEPRHIYLSVENIGGEENPGRVYGIYINLPADASADVAESHYAGNLSFFGLERAQNPRADDVAHPLRIAREITEPVRKLAASGEWDGEHVDITFRPLGLIPHDRPELAHELPGSVAPSDPPVTIGRVSILYS